MYHAFSINIFPPSLNVPTSCCITYIILYLQNYSPTNFYFCLFFYSQLLEKKRLEEVSERSGVRAAAAEALKGWYASREAAVAARKTANRVAEAEGLNVVADGGISEGGLSGRRPGEQGGGLGLPPPTRGARSWQRVARIIELAGGRPTTEGQPKSSDNTVGRSNGRVPGGGAATGVTLANTASPTSNHTEANVEVAKQRVMMLHKKRDTSRLENAEKY